MDLILHEDGKSCNLHFAGIGTSDTQVAGVTLQEVALRKDV